MSANAILKTTFIAGMSIVAPSTTTKAPRRVVIKNIEIATNRNVELVSPSSTRFNNSNRYSREQLLLNKQKLESFKFLQNNWDGYNAVKIDNKIIDLVKELITKLEYQPQIFPTGRGSIQIEKYFDDNNFYEFEISDTGAFIYKMTNGIEYESEVDINEVERIIAEFYG